MKTAVTVQPTTFEPKKYDLIRGDFSAAEALEITNHIIAEKINFHEMKSFSTKIRFGEVDRNSALRIKELKECKAFLSVLIAEAKSTGKTVKIHATISVELI